MREPTNAPPPKTATIAPMMLSEGLLKYEWKWVYDGEMTDEMIPESGGG